MARRANYVRISNRTPIEHLVLGDLRKIGFIQ